MGTTAIAMAALAVVAFLVLAVVLWRGNVEIISGFPEEAGSLKEADRKSMGRAWLPWFCSSCLWRF
ncbi:hypothetical protein NE582_13200 [Gordonibacter pamelaeae]|uniref:hypothetical protein n=1 Tax=Gordonibacter pamelaeae TaxID=471189 RepID=UPI00210B9AC1|nr:hypothetical protein [Gordonibacter pamelaeae]MCQ4848176.1 hypothetical protein [Gordonibacter pamelaeae]MCQ4849427.1 hypothetical protein [Gordonibacter pamelaeae]